MTSAMKSDWCLIVDFPLYLIEDSYCSCANRFRIPQQSTNPNPFEKGYEKRDQSLHHSLLFLSLTRIFRTHTHTQAMGLFSKSSKASSTPPVAPQEAPPPYSSTPQQQQQPQQQYAPPPPPSAPQNPDTRQLSQGWITQFDPSSGRWFYVYTPTGHRQWEHPADRSMGAPPPPQPQQQYGAPYGGYPQQQGYGGYPQQPYGGYPQYGQQQQPQMMMGNQRRAGGGMNPLAAGALGLGAGVLASIS